MDIQTVLASHPAYQPYLFCRGYVITNRRIADIQGFPFYGNWSEYRVGEYYIYVHRFTNFFSYTHEEKTYFLIGHAYNPFTATVDESLLLHDAAVADTHSHDRYYDTISQWTGRFVTGIIDDRRLECVQDCAGMRSLFFGEIRGEIFLSSHAQLIGDLCGLTMDPRIRQLVSSPAYDIGIRFLPGNLTAFTEVKRLGSNTAVVYDFGFRIQRFYPIAPIPLISTPAEYEDTVKHIGDLLHRSMELTVQKWPRAAISLTGGTDSQTTLSAGNGLFDCLHFFSFISNTEESVDAQAAHQLCAQLGLPHTIYEIPTDPAAIMDYEVLCAIIFHNSAYVRKNRSNDLRKMAYLAKTATYDVDIKSWVSEIGRSNFCKRMHMKKLPDHLTPRHLSILYKKIMFDRKLLKFVDHAFKDFIDETGFGKAFHNIDEADMVYWEHRFPGWGGLCLMEFDLCWETTVIYNNRRIIELFLSFPREERIKDHAHKAVVRYLYPELADANIHVVNLSKQKKRIFLERVFFELNSRLP